MNSLFFSFVLIKNDLLAQKEALNELKTIGRVTLKT